MFTVERDKVPGGVIRFVGMAAATWGTLVLPGDYDHTQPGFLALLAVTVAGYLVWLAGRYLTNGLRFEIGGAMVSGLAGAVVCALEGGSPAIAFTCVAAGVLANDLAFQRAVVFYGILTATVGLLFLARGDDGAAALYALFVVLSATIGNGRGRQEEKTRQTLALLRETQRTQAEREQNAALLERGRLARELHDVLAHSLGALAIQLEVVDALLTESGDVDAALPRVRQARRLAVDGLEDARRAVSALRTDAPPLPAALEALVEQHEHLGGKVTFLLSGTPHNLPPEHSLALMRVATESLTNARKHAPGAAASVQLGFEAGCVTLQIDNSPSTAASSDDTGGGAGLAGMRERLALLGGSLVAGPSDDGGWRVVAQVRDAVQAAARLKADA